MSNIAQSLAVQRRHEEALAAYDQLLAEGWRPPSGAPVAHSGTRGDFAPWRGQRAGVLIRLGRVEEATREAEAALAELEPLRPRGGRGRARVLAILAAAKLVDGRAAEAMALLERAPGELEASVPADDPDRVAIEALRGRALLELGRPAEAAAALAQALSIEPAWRSAHPDDLAAARAALARARAPANASTPAGRRRRRRPQRPGAKVAATLGRARTWKVQMPSSVPHGMPRQETAAAT